MLFRSSQLSDTYPLVEYKIGSVRMVTLKRHIEIQGELATELEGYDDLLLSTLVNKVVFLIFLTVPTAQAFLS